MAKKKGGPGGRFVGSDGHRGLPPDPARVAYRALKEEVARLGKEVARLSALLETLAKKMGVDT